MSLRVWLPLDGDLHNYGTSNYTISVFRGTETYDNSGKIGKCFYAHGTNTLKILNILPDVYNYSAYSLCAWCYIEAQNTSHSGSGIISGGNWNSQLLNLAMSDWSSDHYTKLRISGSNWSRTYNYNFYKNTWYHIVVCDDGTHTYGYVNGVLIGDTAASFLPTSIEGTDICIGGATYYNGMQFFGKINDVRIYDHALSAAEVHEIAQGLVLHYKLDGFFGGAGENLVINGDARNGLTGWSNWGTASSRQVITINNKKWFTFKTDANGNYGGFSQDRGMALYKPNTQYTISALMYASTNASGRLWVHTRSTEGGANLAQYLTTVNVTTTPALYTFTFNTGTNASYTINKLNLMIGAVNATSALDFYISNIKVEEGIKATSWVPCKEEGGYDTTKMEDSSGYNHHGTSFGSLISNAETGRYSSSTKLNSSSPTDNSDTGMCYIQTPFALTTPLQMSITWWAKPESGYGGSTNHAAFCTSNNTSRPTDYNTTAFHHRDSGFDIYPSDASGVKRLSFTYIANAWHHYAITYDGSTAKAYQDGVLKTSVAVGSNKTLATFSQLYIGFSQAGGVRRKTLGSYSDFRVYVTALSADDVLALYHTGTKIDNKANVHTYEINENGANKLTKTGILYDNMIESIITLPDGSYWQLLMFHYVDNGNNLFTSSNANNCNDFGLFSRLKDIDNFKLNNQYEFYAIQDDVPYRWIQTNAPLTTTSVAGFSTVSGYTSPGAGICKCSGNTLLARTNSTGNWWNAFGCYTVYSGGIPGLNSVVCKKYLALYARIEKPDVKLSNQTANSFEFIEL